MIDRLEDLIGRKVIVEDGPFVFTGTLRWTTEIDVPGCVDVVDSEGEVVIGGMSWSFDSIEPLDTKQESL